MSSSSGTSSTVRDELMSVWRQTGIKPAELEELVELSPKFTEVWVWFLRMNAKRQGSGFGANPLTFTEMLSFFILIGIAPTYYEVEILERLDMIAMKHSQKETERQSKQKPKNKS